MVLYIDCMLPQNIAQLSTDVHWEKTLAYLLARATIEYQPNFNETALWCHLLEVPCAQKVPVAAFTGLIDQLDTSKHYWLRADPQNLVVKGDQFFAEPILLSELNGDSIASVSNQLKKLFSEYYITLHTPCDDRWYLSMPFDPQLETANVEILQQGVSIEQWLTENANTSLCRFVPWKKLFTEVQMLLHATDMPFNSLWFWGGGFLPTQKIATKPNKTNSISKSVWSDVPLVQGLAHWKQYAVKQDWTNWEQEMTVFSKEQQYLFIYKNKSREEILNFLQQFVRMLKNHTMNTLRLYDHQGRIYTSTPYTIRRFWRYTIPTS